MITKLTISAVLLAMAAPAPVPKPTCSLPGGNPNMSITTAQSDKQWCCCGACCGYAYDCKAVPGCTSC